MSELASESSTQRGPVWAADERVHRDAAIAPTVRLATDIAAQFHHRPIDEAAAAVANHIRQFWDPRMRRQLLAEVDVGTEVDPLVGAAAELLRGA